MKKNKKSNINKKELIVTIVVLILSVLIGFLVGKELFDAYNARI